MNDTEKKAWFLAVALDATEGRDGNFEFTCPLCGGYAIGVRQGWFGSYRASCSRCAYSARGVLDTLESA